MPRTILKIAESHNHDFDFTSTLISDDKMNNQFMIRQGNQNDISSSSDCEISQMGKIKEDSREDMLNTSDEYNRISSRRSVLEQETVQNSFDLLPEGFTPNLTKKNFPFIDFTKTSFVSSLPEEDNLDSGYFFNDFNDNNQQEHKKIDKIYNSPKKIFKEKLEKERKEKVLIENSFRKKNKKEKNNIKKVNNSLEKSKNKIYSISKIKSPSKFQNPKKPPQIIQKTIESKSKSSKKIQKIKTNQKDDSDDKLTLDFSKKQKTKKLTASQTNEISVKWKKRFSFSKNIKKTNKTKITTPKKIGQDQHPKEF